jgi:hypothetical protein
MGRAEKIEALREDVVAHLEELLAIKTQEVNILQEQLALLSKHHVKETKMKDPYGDSGVYTGQIKDDLPHGSGTMKYDDGRVYVGEWNKGRWHGRGRVTFVDGDSYDGEYCYDQRSGRGTYRWRDGRVYCGGFVDDKRCGTGEYTWPDGAWYKGEFLDGKHSGQVSLVLPGEFACVAPVALRCL